MAPIHGHFAHAEYDPHEDLLQNSRIYNSPDGLVDAEYIGLSFIRGLRSNF